jgi:hypothetical protein
MPSEAFGVMSNSHAVSLAVLSEIISPLVLTVVYLLCTSLSHTLHDVLDWVAKKVPSGQVLPIADEIHRMRRQ